MKKRLPNYIIQKLITKDFWITLSKILKKDIFGIKNSWGGIRKHGGAGRSSPKPIGSFH